MDRLLNLTSLRPVLGLLLGITSAVGAPGAAGSAGSEADRTLIVATKESPPFAMKAADGTWTGLSIEVWERAAGELGRKFEYRELGLADMLEQVADGRVDLAISALTVTPERESLMDFHHPYYRGGLGLALGMQRESVVVSLTRSLFSWNFASAVLALVGVLLGAAVAVWLFERRANPEQFGGTRLEGLGASFWWSAVTMTTVGYGDKAPQSLGGRLVAVIWMFTSVIIISSFTAGIASSVTVDRIATDLLRSRPLETLTLATIDGSTGHDLAISRGFRTRAAASLEAALAGVKRGDADAVLYDLPILKYRVMQDPDLDLEILPQVLVPEDYAVALPGESELREPLNFALLKVLRTAAWPDLKRKYLGEE